MAVFTYEHDHGLETPIASPATPKEWDETRELLKNGTVAVWIVVSRSRDGSRALTLGDTPVAMPSEEALKPGAITAAENFVRSILGGAVVERVIPCATDEAYWSYRQGLVSDYPTGTIQRRLKLAS